MRNVTMAILAMFAFVLAGCTSKTGSMDPIKGAACDVETVALTGVAGSISGLLACSGQDAIVASLEQALGNVNFCATPLQSSSALSAKAMAVGSGWQTIGDVKIPKDGGVKSLAVQPQGIVGGLACPIIVNTVIGYLTSSVPSAWKCTSSADAGAVGSAITAACVAAIPF